VSPVRILVTGGAGFIGSNLVDALLREGHSVTVVDNLSTGKFENLYNVKEAARQNRFAFFHTDIRDDSLLAAFRNREQEVVIHLAAQPDVRVSVRDPVLDAEVNVLGTINVLRLAVANGVRRFINTSSGGCVYGEPESLPVSEEAPRRPDSPYGVSKNVAEEYLRYYQRAHGLSYCTLAPANVYGPRQNPFGEAGVVAIFIGRMLAGEVPVIYGDGEQTRDFVFVDDVVEAYLAALTKGDGEFINLGTGVETSINQLYRMLADVLGFEGEPRYAAPRQGELSRIALRAEKAGKILGWKPRTPLPEGLARTVEWYRLNLRR
jgi:UDP-glucose 4-epimerase